VARARNARLRETIEAAGCSYDSIARSVRQVAMEAGDASLRGGGTVPPLSTVP
jgi:hypothetical protein